LLIIPTGVLSRSHEKRAWRAAALQALEIKTCFCLELVHEAEAEPAGVCQTCDAAPETDVLGVRHIRIVKSVEDIEDDMDRTVVSDLERSFEPDI
jgi:hypothetical protein